jgi:hypothetical protein
VELENWEEGSKRGHCGWKASQTLASAGQDQMLGKSTTTVRVSGSHFLYTIPASPPTPALASRYYIPAKQPSSPVSQRHYGLRMLYARAQLNGIHTRIRVTRSDRVELYFSTRHLMLNCIGFQHRKCIRGTYRSCTQYMEEAEGRNPQ